MWSAGQAQGERQPERVPKWRLDRIHDVGEVGQAPALGVHADGGAGVDLTEVGRDVDRRGARRGHYARGDDRSVDETRCTSSGVLVFPQWARLDVEDPVGAKGQPPSS